MAPSVDQTYVDDEISLVDLWLIIRRRWLLLLAGLVIGLSGAIAYIVLTVPIYESRATLRVGNAPNLAAVEDLGVLSVELSDEYGPDAADGAQHRTPYLSKKDIKFKNNILELAAIGRSPEEARDFLAQIAAKTLQRHEQFYTSAIDPLRRRLTAVDGQIGLLTTQLKELSDLVARLKESNPVQASLVAIERGHLLKNLDELERDRVSLQQQVARPYVNPSQIIARPELPEGPVSPRRFLAVVVGIVFGLMLGLVFIFLRQFFEKAKAARSDADSVRERD